MSKLASFVRQLRAPRTLARKAWADTLVRTGRCNQRTIRVRNFVIRFHPAAMARSFFVNPNDRATDHAVITALLRLGDTCVDVGANIGTTVIPAALAVGPTGRVWALEAHPRIARFLAENLALNQLTNVELRACAADAAPGTITLSDIASDDMNAIVNGATRGVTVEAHRLDDIVAGDAPIALLKIDVEGAELRVLAGAPRVLARAAAVYVEVGDAMLRLLGGSAAELVAQLRAAGFELFRINEARGLSPVSLADLLERAHSNVLALRDVAAIVGRDGFSLGA